MTTLDINSTDPRRQYTAGVAQTVFTYPFEIFNDVDLAVYVDGVLQTLNTDYTVSGAGTEGGGSVTFTSPMTGGEIVTVMRAIPYARESLYITSGPFKAATVERDFDTLVAMIQQVNSDQGFSLRVSPIEQNVAADFLLPSVASRAGRLLAFDNNGKPTMTQIGSSYTAYPSVAGYTALRNLATPDDGDAVVVSSNGVAGLFVFDASETATDNGGTIIDPTDGTTGAWVRRYDGPINVKWFGAVGDGVTDDTTAIQAALDAGDTVHFPAGSYLVSKTAAFSGDFPNGDQPCLFLNGKAGYKLTGDDARLVVATHAQGILEIQASTDVEIDGLSFVGPADFPQLDGTTGHSEKGSTATGGYNTTGFWGTKKNNSQDTSANNTGGFGGAFPQYGGGTASTWGVWNGGFIGNIGSGVLVQKACSRITFRNCKASGFNYAGFQVGFRGDAGVGTESFDIRFINCTSVGNYSRGVSTMDVDGVLVEGCVLSGMGHPAAIPETDTYADPGYGYSASGWPVYYTRNAAVKNNLIKDCVRKGVDSHASDGLVIEGNVIRNCAATAISVPWTNSTQPVINTVIRGNFIKNCGYASGALATILGGGAIDGGYSYANSLCNLVIDSNVIEECGGTGIEIKNGRNIQITNNILRGFDDRALHGSRYFMFIGRLSTNEPIYNLNCSGNVCDADGDTDRYRGISVRRAINSQVNHNMLYLDHASVSQGLDLHQCTTTQAFGNVVYVDPASSSSVPISLLQSDGMAIGNYSDPDVGSLSYPLSNETTSGEREKAFRIPHVIQLDITFNGTTSPTYVVNSGEDYVASVQELATYGASITFKNLHSTCVLRSFMTEKSAGGLSTGGGFAGFIYERGLSHTGMEIGLKTTQTGSNILASAVASGTLSVTIMVF